MPGSAGYGPGMNRRTRKNTRRPAVPEFAEVELPRSAAPLVVELSGALRMYVGDSEGVRLAAELIDALGEEDAP
jgi:hypothetical protein